jgi:hypothetical protein
MLNTYFSFQNPDYPVIIEAEDGDGGTEEVNDLFSLG